MLVRTTWAIYLIPWDANKENSLFTYLGLPLGDSRLKVADFTPIYQQIERRLYGCSTMLSFDARILLIRSVFAALPIFYMSTLALHVAIIEQINKYLRNFLWIKYGQDETGQALIAWKTICKPKQWGGQGILDISIHNKALMMKNLHKFFNKVDLPWIKLIWEKYYPSQLPHSRMVGSSWWRNHLKLIPLFKQHSSCKLGNGQTILLWQDKWLDHPLEQKFPELFSFVKNTAQSAESWMNAQDTVVFLHTHVCLSKISINIMSCNIS